MAARAGRGWTGFLDSAQPSLSRFALALSTSGAVQLCPIPAAPAGPRDLEREKEGPGFFVVSETGRGRAFHEEERLGFRGVLYLWALELTLPVPPWFSKPRASPYPSGKPTTAVLGQALHLECRGRLT